MRSKRSDSTSRNTSTRSVANMDDVPKLENETEEPRSSNDEVNRTPEENKNPSNRRVENEMRISDKAGSFTPPPALSPAYSIEGQPEEEEDAVLEKEENAVKKEEPSDFAEGTSQNPGENGKSVKDEKSPKQKYKRRSGKDKDAVPFLDPNAPKRNRSAYVHFIVHRRASYSKTVMSQRDINVALAADWQKLTPEERIPFHEKAEEEKKNYVALMDVYKKTDSHKEFQKRRAQFLSTQSGSKQRKRKHGEDSDDDDAAGVQMAFPKPGVFCPLMNTGPSSSTSAASVQYLGPIFTPEFMSYNKTRDSYRRQLAVERSNLEHELEALNQYDMDVRIQKQEDRLQNVNAKIEDVMTKMRSIFGGVNASKDHLGSIDLLNNWLGSISRLGQSHATKKAVKELITKNGKAIIALRK